MPSTYAHYRFGVGLLPTMPGDVRRTIQRFRRLFDVGLHGPDIFYYQSALSKAASRFLGVKYHEQTGKDFFDLVFRDQFPAYEMDQIFFHDSMSPVFIR